MLKLPIFNRSFAHNGHIVPSRPSPNLQWEYHNDGLDPSQYPFVVFTDESIFQERVPPNGIALIVESQPIIPDFYKHVFSYPLLGHYRFVFTHSQFILDNYRNARMIPAGGVWVGTEYGGGEVKVYPKSKMVSFVTSAKNMCWMHHVRQMMCKYFVDWKCPVDIYGDLTDKWVPIADTLKDYRYSIIVENYIDDNFFTEKILNCFATGTVPIYWGARKIHKYFNMDGIIRITSPGGASRALDFISEADYNNRIEAIKDNFERVQKFLTPEDYIFDNYLSKVTA